MPPKDLFRETISIDAKELMQMRKPRKTSCFRALMSCIMYTDTFFIVTQMQEKYENNRKTDLMRL